MKTLRRKKISDTKKLMLETAQQYCDENDKSTEFMIQYMQDFAGVSFDTVISFLENKEVSK